MDSATVPERFLDPRWTRQQAPTPENLKGFRHVGRSVCCVLSSGHGVATMQNSMNSHVLAHVGASVWGPEMAPWRAPIPATDAKPHVFAVFGDGGRVALRGSSPCAACACPETQRICSVLAMLAVLGGMLVAFWCPKRMRQHAPTHSNSKGFGDAALLYM